MHCSSCEPELDRYLEGTLSPRRMAQIREHLASCASCQGLLDEVKVVDALLFTTDPPALPENFTFAVMADVNSLPVPQAPPHRFWSFLAVYSAAAWVATVVALVVTRTSPAVILGWLSNAYAATMHGIGVAFAAVPQTAPQVAALGIVVLMLDAIIAAGIAYYYFRVRPRFAAVPVASRRAGS